jgi:hypothetical protein
MRSALAQEQVTDSKNPETEFSDRIKSLTLISSLTLMYSNYC